MSFVPRVVWPQDVLTSDPSRILLQSGISRFYEIQEIIKYNNRFYQVISVDRADDILHLRDVTDKITVNGEPA